MSKTQRQVIRNRWLSAAVAKHSGIPIDPTLRYKTLSRTTEKVHYPGMPDDAYILYAAGTYLFNTGYHVDFSQTFAVQKDRIIECLEFTLMPAVRKT